MKRIGHYRLLGKLGQGGMGVVWLAHDERLDRQVALKLIGEAARGEQASQRFWREARAAAKVSHPNVCQLYEIGEELGELFITMELLEGRSLETRLKEGPLPLAEVVQTGLEVLAALETLHAKGVVHRDLKPSNVFVSTHGVKVLDFGLARPAPPLGAEQPEASLLTQPGTMVGTPHYMAPEQVYGQEVDGRADLFSTGTILFEAAAGRTAFMGRSVVEVLHAVLHEQPPALTGGPAVAALDRVLRRSLAKRPEDRYPTAAAMAEELRTVLLLKDSGAAPRPTTVTRLIALPFRMLRPDPETDFLAFSLPDAVSTSLTGLGSLVVRSSAVAARFAADTLDLKRLAAEAEVDVVLTGTLLRGNGQIRVSTQLLEAPAGTVMWSHTAQGSLKDVFTLQDELVHRIVESLSVPLTVREEHLLSRDVPQSASAYEFYLRANHVNIYESANAEVARDLYEQCLERDPTYAPGWARLGRTYRFIGKYKEKEDEYIERAEEAYRRALTLNPDLPLAHHLYTYLETDTGRAPAAMERLLRQVKVGGNAPALLAGLVHACRYCGLLEASLAAHREARRLDPNVPTSVMTTLWLMGEYEQVLQEKGSPIDEDVKIAALAALGRLDEAREVLARMKLPFATSTLQRFYWALRMVVDQHYPAALAEFEGAGVELMRDPEARFHLARTFSHMGEHARALTNLERTVDEGYFVLASGLPRDTWLDPLRATAEFRAIVARAESRRREAAEAFRAGGGEALLGVRV